MIDLEEYIYEHGLKSLYNKTLYHKRSSRTMVVNKEYLDSCCKSFGETMTDMYTYLFRLYGGETEDSLYNDWIYFTEYGIKI